jgi:hypothetical protein
MAIRSEQIEVLGEDSTPRTITVVVDDLNGGVAIDYTGQFEKIALGLETLVQKTTLIADALATADATNLATTLAINGNRMATALEPTDSTNFADNVAIIRGLAQGSGIHTIGAYEWLGLISSYINYVERGEISNTEGNVSEAEKLKAIEDLTAFIEKIKSLPTNF